MSKKKTSSSPSSTTSNLRAAEPDYTKLIIHALRKIMQSLDAHSRRLLKQYDLTVPQVMCLYELSEKGRMTVAVLANNIHLGASTTVGVIDRLEEKKLVKRTRDTNDRRSVFVDITTRGREFIMDTPHLLHNRLHDSLHQLSRNQRMTIANSLGALIEMLEED